MAKIKNNAPTEQDEQVAFVQWLDLQYPHIKYFAIPNGMWAKNFAQVMKAKKSGQKNGAPDLCIPRRPDLGLNCNIWIEMKRIKGGKVSVEQAEWHNYLSDNSEDKVIVAYGCIDAINQLQQFLTQSNN